MENSEDVKVVVLDKTFAKIVNTHLKLENKVDDTFRVTNRASTNKILIPVKNIDDNELLSILNETLSTNDSSDSPSFAIERVPRASLIPTKRQAALGQSGSEQVRALLRSRFGWSEAESSLIPEKWIRYGDIVVLFVAPISIPSLSPAPTANHSESSLSNANDASLSLSALGRPDDVLQAFHASGVCTGLRSILLHRGSIEGELREPQIEDYTPGQSSETIHIENNVKYCFDVKKIMYSPGNGIERIRMSKLKIAKNAEDKHKEIIIDMFCGLGYFSLPLARNNRDNIEQLHAIEKNPNSYKYLCRNIELNKVQNLVSAYNEDNRTALPQLEGRADRILMGYLPNTKDYINRALFFVRPAGCVIHYHHLAKKGEAIAEALKDFAHVLEELGWTERLVVSPLLATKVKSYCPQLYHYCTDLLISAK